MAYEKGYWKISSRNGYNPHRAPDFSEEDEPPYHTMAFVAKSTFGENPWTPEHVIEVITAIAQLRPDLNFHVDITDTCVTVKLGSTGPAYKIEKMPPMQEVFRFD